MSLPLVPLPSAVHEDGDAPALELQAGVQVGGPGADDLAVALSRRTGLDVGTGDDAAIVLALESGFAPEAYRVAVDAASVSVMASDHAGLFYGAATLVQLVRRGSNGWEIPAVVVDDAPRFGYRGVMLDVARHFFSVETVCAYIHRAAALKFNHLHLHLTDDQGWRLDLESRPALAERASGSAVGGDAGGSYSRDDYAAIVAHAASRHMTVVPEIDVPGHTHAVGLAYPELVAAPVITPEVEEAARLFGGGLPAPGEAYPGIAVGFSSLRMRDEGVYAFVADVFGEVAAMTRGPYLHVGGDEALGTDPAEYAEFMARTTAIVAGLGKVPIAWHEAGVAGLAPGTVGQYWGYVDAGVGAAEQARMFARGGGRVILSPADAVYLDMKHSADAPLGLAWANGPTSVRRAYEWEPGAVVPGLAEADILGVEAPMWTETIRTLDDIDEMAFPRLAAAAEAAWSAPLGSSAERSWESFRTRVGGLAALWASSGIRFHRSPEIEWMSP